MLNGYVVILVVAEFLLIIADGDWDGRYYQFTDQINTIIKFYAQVETCMVAITLIFLNSKHCTIANLSVLYSHLHYMIHIMIPSTSKYWCFAFTDRFLASSGVGWGNVQTQKC